MSQTDCGRATTTPPFSTPRATACVLTTVAVDASSPTPSSVTVSPAAGGSVAVRGTVNTTQPVVSGCGGASSTEVVNSVLRFSGAVVNRPTAAAESVTTPAGGAS